MNNKETQSFEQTYGTVVVERAGRRVTVILDGLRVLNSWICKDDAQADRAWAAAIDVWTTEERIMA